MVAASVTGKYPVSDGCRTEQSSWPEVSMPCSGAGARRRPGLTHTRAVRLTHAPPREADMRSTPLPPARLPRGLPLLGHALQLLRNPWTFLATARPLGDVVEIRIGPRPAYLVNNPDLIRRVL